MPNSSQSGVNKNSSPESCPRCRESGKARRLLFVYYNRAEAFSTCESKECAYFVTDVRGDPVKFRFSEQFKRLVPLSIPAKTENTCTEFEELIESLCTTNNRISSGTDTNIPSSSVITNPISNPLLYDNSENVDSASNDCNFDIDSFLNELVPS